MQNLESVIGMGGTRGAAYTLPLRVKLVAVEDDRRGHSSGATASPSSSSLKCAIADDSRFVTAICYNKSLFETLKKNEGKGITLRQFQVKASTLLLTTNTVIGRTAAPNVPHEIEASARAIIVPVDAPVTPIKKILASPEKSVGSFRGTVVALEMEKTVWAFGKEATVRNLTMQDGSGSVKVALWRDKAEIALNVGDYVECKDLIKSKFDDAPVMSTTKNSSIQKKDQPSIRVTTTLISIEASDEQFMHIMCVDEESMSTSTYIFDKTGFEFEDEDTVLELLPLKAVLTVKGQYVQSYEVVN